MEIKGGQPGSWQGTGCRAAAAQAETAASLCVHGWRLKAGLIALVTLHFPCLLHGKVTSLEGTWDKGGGGAHTLETALALDVAELCGHCVPRGRG